MDIEFSLELCTPPSLGRAKTIDTIIATKPSLELGTTPSLGRAKTTDTIIAKPKQNIQDGKSKKTIKATRRTRSTLMEMSDDLLDEWSSVFVAKDDKLVQKQMLISSILYNNHDYEKALPALVILFSLIIARDGDNSAEGAFILKSIACCQYELHLYAASILTREKAIRIWESNGSQKYVSEINFARARIDFCKREFCKMLYPVRFSTDITVFTKKNDELIKKQSKIATELYSKHDFIDALEAFALLLGTVIVKYGEHSVEVAPILEHIGCCQYESGSHEESVRTKREAIRIWKDHRT